MALCFLLAVTLLTGYPGAAVAEEPDTVAAVAFAERLESNSLAFLTDMDVPRAERAKRVREVFTRDFDIEAMARFVLGTYWRAASEEQREKYLKLFEKHLVQQYTLRMENFSGMTIQPVKAIVHDNRDIVVFRETHHTDGMVLDMEWRVREKDGVHKVVDLTVMGISMCLTLRGEFAEIIRRENGGIDALLRSLDKNTRTEMAQAAAGG